MMMRVQSESFGEPMVVVEDEEEIEIQAGDLKYFLPFEMKKEEPGAADNKGVTMHLSSSLHDYYHHEPEEEESSTAPVIGVEAMEFLQEYYPHKSFESSAEIIAFFTEIDYPNCVQEEQKSEEFANMKRMRFR